MYIRPLKNYLPGLMVASVPFAGWSVFNVGNTFAFTASYVISILILIINLPRLMWLVRIDKSRDFLAFYFPLLFVCLLSALPLLFWRYADIGQYLMSLLHLSFFVLVTYCLLQVSDTEKALDFYAISYTLTAVFVAIIGLIDYALILKSGNGLGIEFNTIARTEPGNSLIGLLPRASSIFFEPGWFAHYLLIDIIVVIFWLLPRYISMRLWVRVWILRTCVLLMLLALLATLSAATFVIAGVLVLFVIFNRPHPLSTMIFIVLTLLMLYLIPMPNDLPNPIEGIFERLFGLVTGATVAGESVDTRSDELAAAIKMFADSLFLGVGYGQSAYYISSVSGVGTGGISSFYGILFAETGLLGLLAFVFSIVALNYKLWRMQKNIELRDIAQAHIVFCCRCVILAETLYLNFFSAMASPTYVGSFWFALIILKPRPVFQHKRNF